MSFFSQVIVPRLCDFLLNKSLLARHRRELLAPAHGDVLEIGFGTGLNLPYYPKGSTSSRRLIRTPECTGWRRSGSSRGGSRLTSTFSAASGCPSRTTASIAPSARLPCAASKMSPRRCGKCIGCSKAAARSCSSNTALARSRASRSGRFFHPVEIGVERTSKTHGYMYRGVATK